jgi:DNA polymerase V
MFTDQTQLEREKKMQHAMLDIKKKYGKNAVMKANNLQSKATAIERNGQIGGHRA